VQTPIHSIAIVSSLSFIRGDALAHASYQPLYLVFAAERLIFGAGVGHVREYFGALGCTVFLKNRLVFPRQSPAPLFFASSTFDCLEDRLWAIGPTAAIWSSAARLKSSCFPPDLCASSNGQPIKRANMISAGGRKRSVPSYAPRRALACFELSDNSHSARIRAFETCCGRLARAPPLSGNSPIVSKGEGARIGEAFFAFSCRPPGPDIGAAVLPRVSSHKGDRFWNLLPSSSAGMVGRIPGCRF